MNFGQTSRSLKDLVASPAQLWNSLARISSNMSPKTVPYDVEVSRVSLVSHEIVPCCTVAGTLANLVLLNQDNDQVGHLQTNKPRVCCRLTRSKVSIN